MNLTFLRRLLKPLVAALALTTIIVWWRITPPGLLGKTVGVGYAVCHRLPAHSPFFGEVQFPLCFRCSGMYLSTFVTWVGLSLTAPRAGAFPKRGTLAALVAFFLGWAFDGLNAFAADALGRSLYPPANLLRLVTGLGMGITMGTVLYAVVQQTFWREWHPQPALTLPRLGGLLLAVAGVGWLMVWRPPALLYPLALLSTGTVVGMLTLIYTAFAVGLTRRENQARTWWDLRWFLLAGLTAALFQIIVLDAGRLALTHAWVGVRP